VGGRSRLGAGRARKQTLRGAGFGCPAGGGPDRLFRRRLGGGPYFQCSASPAIRPGATNQPAFQPRRPQSTGNGLAQAHGTFPGETGTFPGPEYGRTFRDRWDSSSSRDASKSNHKGMGGRRGDSVKGLGSTEGQLGKATGGDGLLFSGAPVFCSLTPAQEGGLPVFVGWKGGLRGPPGY